MECLSKAFFLNFISIDNVDEEYYYNKREIPLLARRSKRPNFLVYKIEYLLLKIEFFS